MLLLDRNYCCSFGVGDSLINGLTCYIDALLLQYMPLIASLG